MWINPPATWKAKPASQRTSKMTAMVQTQRAYQLNLQALKTIDEMTGQALQLRR